MPGETPCLKCLFPDAPPKETIFPVVGAVSGVIGCIQAIEAVKYLTGTGELLTGKLLLFDLEKMHVQKFTVRRLKDCFHCGVL